MASLRQELNTMPDFTFDPVKAGNDFRQEQEEIRAEKIRQNKKINPFWERKKKHA